MERPSGDPSGGAGPSASWLHWWARWAGALGLNSGGEGGSGEPVCRIPAYTSTLGSHFSVPTSFWEPISKEAEDQSFFASSALQWHQLPTELGVVMRMGLGHGNAGSHPW